MWDPETAAVIRVCSGDGPSVALLGRGSKLSAGASDPRRAFVRGAPSNAQLRDSPAYLSMLRLCMYICTAERP